MYLITKTEQKRAKSRVEGSVGTLPAITKFSCITFNTLQTFINFCVIHRCKGVFFLYLFILCPLLLEKAGKLSHMFLSNFKNTNLYQNSIGILIYKPSHLFFLNSLTIKQWSLTSNNSYTQLLQLVFTVCKLITLKQSELSFTYYHVFAVP